MRVALTFHGNVPGRSANFSRQPNPGLYSKGRLSESAPKQAAQENCQDCRRQGDVEKIPLPREGVDREKHARHRRRDQQQQSQLNDAAALERGGALEDEQRVGARRRPPLDTGAPATSPAVTNEIQHAAEQYDSGRENDAPAQQIADKPIDTILSPCRRRGHHSLPVKPLKIISTAKAKI